jgi:transposase
MGTSRPAVIEAIPSGKAVPSSKRQHRSPEVKRKIVEETLAPGASVARVARAHGINANQVFQWRRLYRAGGLGAPIANASRLLPVRVSEEAAKDIVLPAADVAVPAPSGRETSGTQSAPAD